VTDSSQNRQDSTAEDTISPGKVKAGGAPAKNRQIEGEKSGDQPEHAGSVGE
jgi:hypothetical protein